ncbi:MAG: hypothetical protein LBT98_01570, partial [Puniceicoccales bacterium]|nr:hypothetical protein [Puniceicoccales bacterium]
MCGEEIRRYSGIGIVDYTVAIKKYGPITFSGQMEHSTPVPAISQGKLPQSQSNYSDGKTPGFGIYRRLKEKVGEDFSRFRLWSTAKAVVVVVG